MTTITVHQGDALPDVLERVRQAAGEPAAVEIPPASSLFLTASEFRALRAVAERDGIDVSVATDDPLRQQLAALFGLPVVSRHAPQHESPSEAPRGQNQRKSIATSSTPEDHADTPIGPDQRTPRLQRPNLRALPSWEHLTGRLAARDRKAIATVGAALASALVVAYILAALFLTRATIVLIVKRQPVSQEVTYALLTTAGAAPAGAAFAMAATPVSFDLSVEQTVSTTGIKTVGDGVASGTIVLRNTTASEVVIEAGTRFTSFEGTDFEFVQTVTIPPAKGDGAQPGQAEATVRCTVPGTVGNRELGMLTGMLRPGVYYSNRRAAITGGTDKEIPVVSEADVAALKQQALQAIVAEARGRPVANGQMIEPASIQAIDLTFAFDHQPGDEATRLGVRATARVTALAVDAQAMRQALANALSTSAPAGYEIDPETIQWSGSETSAGSGSPALYTARIEAQARAQVTSDQRQALAKAVAGKSRSVAMQRARALAPVESVAITYSPWWLPDRIPRSAGRIAIVVK
jgi:hypothetical protein